MWPFEQRHDVLRIGRNCAELWAWSARGVMPVGHQALAGAPVDATALQAGVDSLLKRGRRTPAIDVVVESAWLPVLQIEPGPTLLSQRSVEALLLHRLNNVYGAPPSGAWQLRVEHRAGERTGLGFALAPAVRAAIVDAAATAGRRVASIQPAISWARSRLRRHVPNNAWLLWMEQDRSLVARLELGRVRALNPAAPHVGTVGQARRCVEVEALRQGEPGSAPPVVVGGWGEGPRRAEGLVWLSVAAPELSDISSAAVAVEGTA